MSNELYSSSEINETSPEVKEDERISQAEVNDILDRILDVRDVRPEYEPPKIVGLESGKLDGGADIGESMAMEILDSIDTSDETEKEPKGSGSISFRGASAAF